LDVLAVLLVCVNAAFALRALSITLRSKATLVAGVAAQGPQEFVSIVVPARNEERNIERCVRSLAVQQYSKYEIIAVDDGSEDATPQILERMACEITRLRIVRGAALPPGWVGKPWALEQGVRVARGSWLLFTDADTEHDPLALQSAYAYAQGYGLGALSVITDQELVTLAERAILPTILLIVLFSCGSLDEINDSRSSASLFNGQFILIRRDVYEMIGGHGAVRDAIAEDLELARKIKEDGRLRSALVRSGGLIRTRMYRSFGEIWNGFVKNLAPGARGRSLLAASGLALLACIAPITPLAFLVALALHAWIPVMLCALGMLLSIAASALAMQRFRLDPIAACALPLGITLTVAMFLTSVARYATGGVWWRGRRYGRRDFGIADKTNSYGHGG
jgi:chlorobactene glucosyltransferase